MRRILVYESLSGGGEPGLGDDAASLLSQGLAMRDAVVADLLRIDTLQVSRAICALPGAAQPLVHPRLANVSPRPHEAAVAFVQRMAAEHDLVWAVAPETDGVLLALHEAVGTAAWIGCEAQAIRTASSKRATLAALAARGVTTPLAFAEGDATTTRWIVKPDDGAGSIDTRVHTRREAALADLAARHARGLSATAEPLVEGEALSVSLLAGPGFVQPLALNRQRIVVEGDGRLQFLGVQINALDRQHDTRAVALHLAALDVARVLPGLRGFVGIDVVWHATRGPVVIEVNPRTTCAYVGLSAALGRNLAEEVLMLQQLPTAVASPTDAHR